jgi:hypothetical protein
VTTQIQVTVYGAGGVILGWVRRDEVGDEIHPSCCFAVRQNQPFHAIPEGFAGTLSRYHYESWDAAIAALAERTS